MFLNTFNKKDVLEVFDYLLSKDSELIFASNVSNLTREEAEKEDAIILCYDRLFHRLILKKMDYSKPLYPNPNYIVRLIPKELFIALVKPSDDYNKIMSD